ncbi:hypothetical protein [Nostocoides sp. Soil756]|jgi:hypothetical protein|uniref:hypothetical protein n=1 Tax=Nostocoides sp. Soil756 TaxID=1736399 RepID=UPI0006F773CC|nr:hypothetical protein [Tetrasphaera sp. Soil756]KRE62945.1 hypothetical protein ASG78_08275 [Tetrasphaera sp. Soil756]
MTIDVIDQILGDADPAVGTVPHRDPELVLREILSSVDGPPRRVAHSTQGRRYRVARVALIGMAAAALLAVPVVTSRDTAYAGWTAYPAALSTGQFNAVTEQCQEWIHGSITDQPTQVVLSERRGNIGLALVAGTDGLLVTCEQDLDAPREPSGGSTESHLTQAPRADQIISNGGSAFSESDDDPIFCVVSGRVGSDVTGLVVHTEEQGDVTATVQDGYFTAWWPGPSDSARTRRAGLPMNFTFTAKLNDGTTRSFSRSQTEQ